MDFDFYGETRTTEDDLTQEQIEEAAVAGGLQIRGMGTDEKIDVTPADIQTVEQALREALGREPTTGEIMEGLAEYMR